MKKLLEDLATKLFELLGPMLIDLIGKELEKWIPKIVDIIGQELTKWLPKIIQTVVVSMSQAAGQLVVNTTDKVTDIIPTQIDDAILDPIVNHINANLRKLGLPL